MALFLWELMTFVKRMCGLNVVAQEYGAHLPVVRVDRSVMRIATTLQPVQAMLTQATTFVALEDARRFLTLAYQDAP